MEKSQSSLMHRLAELQRRGQVRLDAEEVDALAFALEDLPFARVALFGSRADPQRRGGDIDLLVLTDAPAFETSRHIATRFFSRCEEKIDVVVFPLDGGAPDQQAFLNSINRVELA